MSPINPLILDKTVPLAITGSTQRIRLCATRPGAAPLLIVQAGPGLPLLQEAPKFQKLLGLENDFLVAYWEQRGCGKASKADANRVSMPRQVDDLRAVLRWLNAETGEKAILFAISLGATISLQAAEHEPGAVKSIIAVSADSNTAASDASVDEFLKAKSSAAGNSGLAEKMKTLGDPPYTDTTRFQLRSRLMADLGGIERGKKFSALLREALFGMVRAYGVIGAGRALRNMNLIQRKLLPEIALLDLFANPPQLPVPIHYIFGEQDPLTPASLVRRLPAAVAASETTVTLVPDAAHMVHFDHPEIVRSIVLETTKESAASSAAGRARL